jgi:hypothetical protein
MNSMFGGGPQGQFGSQSFGNAAGNPMGSGMQFQEVGMATGEIVYSKSIGTARPKDRSGRRTWPWNPQGRR